MIKSLRSLMLFGVLLLIACASKKDANEKNFSEALNSYLAKKGQLCLGIPSTWPVDLNEAERGAVRVRRRRWSLSKELAWCVLTRRKQNTPHRSQPPCKGQSSSIRID